MLHTLNETQQIIAKPFRSYMERQCVPEPMSLETMAMITKDITRIKYTVADCHAVAKFISTLIPDHVMLFHEADNTFYTLQMKPWPTDGFPVQSYTPR